MTGPLPLPVRVLVKGASTVVWMSEHGGPRSDFTYPRAIEAELLAQGIPATVDARARGGAASTHLLKTWENDVMAWSPDVIVLHIGHYECIHFLIPRWLERHANDLRRRPTRWRRRYRRRIIRPVYSTATKLQQRLDARFGARFATRRTRRVVTHAEEYIRLAQRIGSPLILVLELPPSGSRYARYFPGFPARIAAMNQALSDMVERIGLPQVSWVPNPPTFDDDPDVVTPDGIHLTPKAHRMLGEHLADLIGEWTTTQPHLAHPGEPAGS